MALQRAATRWRRPSGPREFTIGWKFWLILRARRAARFRDDFPPKDPAVLKWLLTLAIALVILTAASPFLARFGLGRLPGDVTVRYNGRDYYLPFTTTILLSIALTLIARFL
jgi:hypothetical protein